MKAASHAQTLAGTLNVPAANAGTGVDAIIGGLATSLWRLGTIGYVATGIARLTVLMVPWIVLQGAR